MPLDPQAKQLLEQMDKANLAPIHTLTPEQARQQMLIASRFLGPLEPIHAMIDRTVPGPGGPIPIRVYRPGAEGPLPAVVYFHGGCWVMGNIQTHDAYCRALANRARAVVVSVDYRLAPEHKFPAGVEDAFAATCWVAENASMIEADAARIAVAGDSAGGNLAAAVALMARDRGGPALAFQLLIYPIVDFNFETPSYRENATGFLLTRDDMVWSWKHYLANELDGYTPYASPMRAEDHRGLPLAMIVTAEFDPLRDEGEAYARTLEAAGVPAMLHRYDGMIHGFVRRTDTLDKARQALDDVAAALDRALRP